MAQLRQLWLVEDRLVVIAESDVRRFCDCYVPLEKIVLPGKDDIKAAVRKVIAQ